MVLGVQGCSETRWMGRWAAQVALARAQAFFCFFFWVAVSRRFDFQICDAWRFYISTCF